MREPRRLPKFTLNHEQMMKVLLSIPADTPVDVRDRAMLEVLYSSAMRRMELAHLKLEDLQLDGGLVMIADGKMAKDRVVPIGTHAVEWLKRYIQSARPSLLGRCEDHRYLFINFRGQPLNLNRVSWIVQKCAKRAGFENVTGAHSLRRSCATELVRNGANLGHVKDILGHEDYASLKSYVRLVVADLKEALRKFHPRERGTSGGGD